MYEVTDQDLRDLFSPFGEVTMAEVVRYQKSKRSKGFGFVRLATEEQVQTAIQALNNQDYRGRKLFLDIARSEDPTEEIKQKQQQTAKEAMEQPPAATFTPVEQSSEAPETEEVSVEEVHPEVKPAEETPAPEQHEDQSQSTSFGTIFSNSPDKTEGQ